MADISVSSNVSVKLSEEEVEILRKAHDVLKEVSNTLWQNDAEDTDAYGYSSEAQEGIYYFLKNEIGINVDEARVW